MASRFQIEDVSVGETAEQTVIGKDAAATYERLERALYRQTNGHVLITGLPGVGKTSFVREFSRRVESEEIGFLADWQIVHIDCRHIQPEETRSCMLTLSEFTVGTSPLVLCIDGLGALLKREGGGNNVSLLRKILDREDVKLIGVLSTWDYYDLIGNGAEMRELFTRIEIEEPDEQVTTEIVQQEAGRLMRRYDMKISEAVVERMVSLSSHYILNSQQPAKSLSLLERVFEDADYDRTQRGSTRTSITEVDIYHAISGMTNIPVDAISGHDGRVDYLGALELAVVGQQAAVRTVAQGLRLIKAGLNDPQKPAAVMLFAGMTGVGKTELAKRVAELYSTSKRLITYTMGNFTEPHSVSGIIGVPPGYVGYEEGGRLINELNADPYSVFLLDEAEKAHPNVWKPFLNLFDEGWIIDQRGVKAYADRAIFILTTNAGDRAITQMARSGKPVDEISEHIKTALSRIRQERSSQPVFPPQFLARIQNVIAFTALDESAMIGITRRVVDQLQCRWWQKRRKHIKVAKSVIELIGRRAFKINEDASGREGGRIVRKFVTDLIEIPIQDIGLNNPHSTRSRLSSVYSRTKKLPNRSLSASSLTRGPSNSLRACLKVFLR
ncbi:MAG: AAA family ATPase [Planctomycetaceae bacterium]